MAGAQLASPIVAELERAYAQLRRHHPELPERVVFVMGAGAARSGVILGMCTPSKWAHREPGTVDKPVSLPEVMISGECLSEGGHQVMQTLVHESAHLLATARKIQDTSRQNRWHNKRFVKLAEELGMEYTYGKPDPKIGWSAVSLTEETAAKYAKTIAKLDEVISVAIGLGFTPDPTPGDKPPRTVLVLTFEDGVEVEIGTGTYGKLAEYLQEHSVEEVTK